MSTSSRRTTERDLTETESVAPSASRRVEIVAAGEILWDIYEAGDRRPGETIARDLHAELGGAPANVAVGLARLGVETALFGGIGDDAFGESMRAALVAAGVRPDLLVTRPERTGLTFVRRDERGEPTFLFYRRQSADVSVAARDVPASLLGASWVVVGSNGYTTPRLRNSTHALIRLARRENVSVAVDLNVREHLWSNPVVMREHVSALASRADLLKVSDADLRAVTSDPPGWLARHAPKATVLVTRGAGMSAASGAHGEVELAPEIGRVIDATGAGDAFLAGVLAALVAAKARPGSGPWQDAAVFRHALSIGHSMGQKAVSAVGAVSGLVDLEPIRAALQALAAAPSATRASS